MTTLYDAVVILQNDQQQLQSPAAALDIATPVKKQRRLSAKMPSSSAEQPRPLNRRSSVNDHSNSNIAMLGSLSVTASEDELSDAGMHSDDSGRHSTTTTTDTYTAETFRAARSMQIDDLDMEDWTSIDQDSYMHPVDESHHVSRSPKRIVRAFQSMTRSVTRRTHSRTVSSSSQHPERLQVPTPSTASAPALQSSRDLRRDREVVTDSDSSDEEALHGVRPRFSRSRANSITSMLSATTISTQVQAYADVEIACNRFPRLHLVNTLQRFMRSSSAA